MKITARLWLYMTAIVTLVLALVWIFLIVLLPDTYFQNATDELSTLTDGIVSLIGQSDPDALSDETRQKLFTFNEQHGLRTELLSPDGGRLFVGGWGDTLSQLTETDLRLVRDGQYVTKRFTRASYGETLLSAAPLYRDSKLAAILCVYLPMAPVEDTLGILSEQLLIVIAMSLLISVGIAFLLSRSFVRPIREMEQVAMKIAQGHYEAPLHLRDRSEIGDLARTLNHMSTQLQQVENMRQQFIATVSHQFKTPLSIIQGHAELMQDTMPPEVAQRYETQFSVISDEIRKLDRMARDMMRLSQFQTAAVSYAMSQVDLSALAMTIQARFAVLETDTKLVVDIPEALTVESNRDALGDVLENLIQNAFRHANASQITLSAREEQTPSGSCVLLRVSDDGIGLTQEQQERIWDRFYKADKNDRFGNGLGMAIVKAILDSIGAEYGIVVNNGTEIWIRLKSS